MFYHIVNPQIKLKLLEPGHTEELYALTDKNRDYLGEWLPWVKDTQSSEQTGQFIDAARKQFAANKGFNCGIFYQGQLAGCIGFHSIDWNNKKSSIGYWLGAEYQGLGIMTGACRTLMDYAFNELELNRMEIRAGLHNYKSRAIPERLGFVLEGTIRQAEWLNGRYMDHVIYGMLSDDWIKQQEAADVQVG